MNRRDILEIKKRLKKESCSISRLCGCYVDANHEKVVKLNENFLNLDDEEFYKYLEIAKKTLSGTIGNNLLELDFPTEEEAAGGKQQFLMGLRASELDNEDLLDRFYDLIIEQYDYVGNYLILIFHDTYDIITKTNDNLKIDESEEVYEYLLCAVCPVTLSKPGLGYRQDENRIGARIRDWIVGVPDVGFLFPAFLDRSADIHKVDYYIRDAKNSHAEFIEGVLGCGPKKTATEQKQAFHAIVKKAAGPDEEKGTDILLDIQDSLSQQMAVEEEEAFAEESTVLLTTETISKALEDSGIDSQIVDKICEDCKQQFGDEIPLVKNVIDQKALEANEKEKEKRELVKEVAQLKSELIEKSELIKEGEELREAVKTYDVILRVKPEKADQIKSQMVGDQKYVMIPMDDNEHININGVNTQV